MKRLGLWASLLMLAMVSCTSTVNNVDVPVNFKVIDIQVNSNEWSYSNAQDNNYFYATFNIPELTKLVYDGGVVNVYRETGTGTADAIQAPLPITRMLEAIEGEQVFLYQELVDFDYGVGTMTIYYTVSDFIYEADPAFVPADMHFRVTLIW